MKEKKSKDNRSLFDPNTICIIQYPPIKKPIKSDQDALYGEKEITLDMISLPTTDIKEVTG